MTHTSSREGVQVHASALVDPTAELASDVVVGPHCTVGAGCSVGAASVLVSGVTIGDDVAVGLGVTLAPGVFVHTGTSIGDSVSVGPNATILGSDSSGRADPSVVRTRASIGANASVLPGVTIGMNAVVGVGAVVTRDVPPYATVVGSPARIVGYESSPLHPATRHLRASAISDEEFPLEIGRATLHRFPHVEDLRGSLTFGETPTHLPFVPKRYFLVYDVPSREVRGEHAHRTLHQLLVCAAGECAVAVDDGTVRGEVMLDRRDVALHVPPMVWASQYKYSADAALLVLASAEYDEADYVRSYDEFEAELARG